MLFIDYSSAFNTIVLSKLITKLRILGLNTSLCNWILDFLTGRPQVRSYVLKHTSDAADTTRDMASARQSALEYIRNGRLHLIRRLQNLPLIVENLFQRKVLHEEEVSKIQAEVDRFDQTRRILDWVSAKGEAACYELLTILYITRKRTLDDADLQQWISCFPFEEDPEMTDYLVGK
ncbi:hypothetical protein J4Q44_G00038120 [Coregonus suidteri]|uniref:CARD domain-containing protein n=1 Tax=Coregonus suidteri TaxID=861788 RepID=A0AAN8R166_9TELE